MKTQAELVLCGWFFLTISVVRCCVGSLCFSETLGVFLFYLTAASLSTLLSSWSSVCRKRKRKKEVCAYLSRGQFSRSQPSIPCFTLACGKKVHSSKYDTTKPPALAKTLHQCGRSQSKSCILLCGSCSPRLKIAAWNSTSWSLD